MKKIALFQSNYIPWKGYFDIINDVDVFVFYDDVQYTKRDWRNRNIIKPKTGTQWLIVPVVNDKLREKKIYEVEIDSKSQWQEKHLKTLMLSYSKAPYINQYTTLLEEIYQGKIWMNLAEMNVHFTKLICKELGIVADFHNLQDLNVLGDKDGERVINVCKKLGCNYVINGPAAQDFTDMSLFDEAGITIEFKNYDYPTYRQLNLPFVHKVSILDLLINTGHEAPYYIWGWKEKDI